MAEIITLTRTRPINLADLMDVLGPDAHGIGPEAALSLLASCGDDVDRAVKRLRAHGQHHEHHEHLRDYLVRRGLMSVVGSPR